MHGEGGEMLKNHRNEDSIIYISKKYSYTDPKYTKRISRFHGSPSIHSIAGNENPISSGTC